MIFRLKNILLLFTIALYGCSFYSFKGSIPAHIKSVYISPIQNKTMESSITNVIKTQLEKSFIKENVLKLLPQEDAGSRIDITITSFTDLPYSYDIDDLDATGFETVNAYEVTIKASVEWYDVKNDLVLFQQQFVGFGRYDPNVDIGLDGIDNDNDTFIDGMDDDEFGLPRESAINFATDDIVNLVISNIVSTW